MKRHPRTRTTQHVLNRHPGQKIRHMMRKHGWELTRFGPGNSFTLTMTR